jgi:hypothetical protein
LSGQKLDGWAWNEAQQEKNFGGLPRKLDIYTQPLYGTLRAAQENSEPPRPLESRSGFANRSAFSACQQSIIAQGIVFA